MLYTLVQSAILVALTARHVAAEISIDTPTLTQCKEVDVQWSGGQGPYNLYVVPSSDSCADSLVDLPEQSGTSFKWKVNVPAGSSVELLVEDSTGDEGWTGVITVGNGTDSSCVDKKAAEALSSAKPEASSSAAASSAAGSPSAAPSAYGAAATPAKAAATVQPAPPAGGLANAANDGDNSQSSGSLPRATLSVGSLFATAAFFLAIAHL